MAKEGSISDFAKRGEGFLCHNNLYLSAKIFPILAIVPGLIIRFSFAALLALLILAVLLLLRVFVVFPKIACGHCRAKHICPNAQAMGIG
jgi:hypothetical protein